jgi:hypothetical protein
MKQKAFEYKNPKKRYTYSAGPAVNPLRREEKAEMERLGIQSKKAYRKWQRRQRRERRLQEAAKGDKG